MLFTDRVFSMQGAGLALRFPAMLLGIQLILAGILIAVFPQILVFMIASLLIMAGVFTIAIGLRRNRTRTEQFHWE